MTADDYKKKTITAFFDATEPVKAAYQRPSMSYLAVRHDGNLVLMQGMIHLGAGPSKPSPDRFQSSNVEVAYFTLADVKLDAQSAIDQLLSGALTVPGGKLLFPPGQNGQHGVHYMPFHPAGLQSRNRIGVLRLSGADQQQFLAQPQLDWELKASQTPYDGLLELMTEFRLGILGGTQNTVDIVANTVTNVQYDSPVVGTRASVNVHLALELEPSKLSVGYRTLIQGKAVARGTVPGSKMKWEKQERYYVGVAEIEIPTAAHLHCIATYDGQAQHFGWIADKTTVQNPLRSAFEAFDPQLETLKDIIAKAQGRGVQARDLEAAVSWLLGMLGFNVLYLGSTKRTEEAADLVASPPSGHFVVVECTTGLLKADNKLARLHERAQAVRRSLDAAGNHNRRVLPAIVTTKTRADIEAELAQAESLGILVVTKEDLDRSLDQTLVYPNADALFERAMRGVEEAKAQREAQPSLPLSAPAATEQ